MTGIGPLHAVRIHRQPLRFGHGTHGKNNGSHVHRHEDGTVCTNPHHDHDHGPKENWVKRIFRSVTDWLKAFFNGIYQDIKELLSFSTKRPQQEDGHDYDHADHDHPHDPKHPPLNSVR